MKPPGPGAVALVRATGPERAAFVPPARAHLQGPRSRRGAETVAEREMPPGIPRPGGMQTITSLSLSPGCGSGRGRGLFFAPGLGRGGGKSVTGEHFLLRRWVKGDLGAPRPLRAQGRGCFLGPVGPSAEESALFSGKIRGLTAETPDFS
jgi:hypothetical protein